MGQERGCRAMDECGEATESSVGWAQGMRNELQGDCGDHRVNVGATKRGCRSHGRVCVSTMNAGDKYS